ncbi:TerD family protein [Commensalibacter nepenthis]|uniref:TerD family protein n=1 Tax=Commensalibacter nepenthis TaxID=3043872 RepID=A0ABT6Q805_9PROT|nr:TerD family protein [Commensalibacter sp. TBRC 10068]MDI2112906.1 TerD family protein [Commensalibacter sp. TBRC 10068]
MIIRGQRFDLLNRRQIIDLEIEKPENIPENTLQLMVIPLESTGDVLKNWMPTDTVTGTMITKLAMNRFRIIVDTTAIPSSVHTLLTIIHAEKAGMMRVNIKNVGNIFVRVNNELFDLKEYSDGRAIIAFSMYRRNMTWRFRAIGEAYLNGLEDIYQQYDIPVHLAPHRQ